MPSSDQAWNEDAQIIQATLAQIGVTISIRSIELAAFKAAFEAFDYDLFIDNAINDISDPDEMASFELDARPRAARTRTGPSYNDPATTALVHQAAESRVQDTAKRAALYAQIQQKVATDVPFVPLSYPTSLKATSSSSGDSRSTRAAPSGWRTPGWHDRGSARPGPPAASMSYLARRAARSVVIIAGVIVLTFLLLHVVPGDPARQMLGNRATDAQVARSAALGPEPAADRAVRLSWPVFGHADTGNSLYYNVPTRSLIVPRIGATLELVAMAASSRS